MTTVPAWAHEASTARTERQRGAPWVGPRVDDPAFCRRRRRHLVNRYYDPATEQFISVDPLVSQTGQPFGYAEDDPVNGSDPSGLVFQDSEGGPGPGEYISPSGGAAGDGEVIEGAGTPDEVVQTAEPSWADPGQQPDCPNQAAEDARAFHTEIGKLDVNDLDLSGTNEAHATEYARDGRLSRPYMSSSLTVRSIVEAGEPIADPGGVASAARWDVPGSLNGVPGAYQLVIDLNTNTVLHFLFVTEGP